ncbi:MAG: hypothetical protein ACFNZW_09345, partial [Coriobacteriaceae bacterium]
PPLTTTTYCKSHPGFCKVSASKLQQTEDKVAFFDTSCKKLLNIKNTAVEAHDIYNDQDGGNPHPHG